MFLNNQAKPRTDGQKAVYIAKVIRHVAKMYSVHRAAVGVPCLAIADGTSQCYDHGRTVSCLTCLFNCCQVCGVDMRPGLTLWAGRCAQCGPDAGLPRHPHAGLVARLLGDRDPVPEEQLMKVRFEIPPPLPRLSRRRGLAVPGASPPIPAPVRRRQKRVAVRRVMEEEQAGGPSGNGNGLPLPLQHEPDDAEQEEEEEAGPAPPPPPALAIARAVPVAEPAGAQAAVPQINIAIAPQLDLAVERTSTNVRRIGDGGAGEARFEITVSVIISQGFMRVV